MIAGGVFSFAPLAEEWLWERVFDGRSSETVGGSGSCTRRCLKIEPDSLIRSGASHKASIER